MRAKTYYPGFHGLRTIAAGMVLFHHIALGAAWLKMPTQYTNFFSALLACIGLQNFIMKMPSAGPALDCFGKKGVELFFVLSGFLITSLLLQEKSCFSKVSIKNFYIRRTLRIWPLYYLVLIVSNLVLPHFAIFDIDTLHPVFDRQTGWKVFFASLIFMNVGEPAFFAGPLWSVMIEEQFYLIWPHIVNFAKGKIFLWAIFSILPIVYFANQTVYEPYSFWFDLFPAGAFFAFINFHRWETTLRAFYHPVVQLSVYALVIGYFVRPIELGFNDHLLTALLFGVVILNVGTNPRTLLRLENRYFRFFGELSYGIYCFNWVAIVIVMKLFQKYRYNWGCKAEACMYGLCCMATLILAYLSYVLFERRLLMLKDRFARIKTLSHESSHP